MRVLTLRLMTACAIHIVLRVFVCSRIIRQHNDIAVFCDAFHGAVMATDAIIGQVRVTTTLRGWLARLRLHRDGTAHRQKSHNEQEESEAEEGGFVKSHSTGFVPERVWMM